MSEAKPGEQVPCRATAMRIRVATVALSAAMAVAVAASHRSHPTLAAALAAMVLVLGRLAEIDLAIGRLRERLSGPVAVAAVLAMLVAAVSSGVLEAAAGGLSSVEVAALLLAVAGVLTVGVGLGDAKLGFSVWVVAGWLGSTAMVVTAMTTSLSGAVAALALRAAAGQREIAYGPYLALGSVAGMVAAGVAR
jgi:leader peptidase (prepilin peptidase)/N-methyltransferase